MTQMTVDLLKATLPKALQGNATQELADLVNNVAVDPEVAEEVRSNFLSYTKVLQEGKFKTEDYLNAVVYVTHKLMEYSNQDAYIRTFPARYQALVAKGASAKDISAYVAAYAKNKLVNLILEQSAIPVWLLNRDIYQRAINTQFELMTDSNVSDKVRAEAANSILTHLKAPEVKKVELDIGVKESSGVADLMATMRQLAQQQRELIQGGVPARTVARQGLVIEGRAQEVIPQQHGTAPASLPPRLVQQPVQQRQPSLAPMEERVAAPAPKTDVPAGPSGPVPSLFSQPSGVSRPGPRETAPTQDPGAAPASAASPAGSAEGVGDGVGEQGPGLASAREAVAPVRRVSLFDPAFLDEGLAGASA